MKVQQEHRQFVVDNVKKMTAFDMQKALNKQGLTMCQANCCVRNQRVKLGVYKNASLDCTFDAFKAHNKLGKWKFKGGQPIKKEKGDKNYNRMNE